MKEKLAFDRRRSRVKYCPCGKKNDDGKFAPFKGFDDKGHCHSCGNTFHPDSSKSVDWRTVYSGTKSKFQPESVPNLIPFSIFKRLCEEGNNNQNHFLQWLASPERFERKEKEYPFDFETVNMLIDKYFLATYRENWILFPYIDAELNIRDIKAMDYNLATGKRIAVKNGDSKDRCHFIGNKLLSEQGFSEPNLKRCFYGEHLLKGNNKPVKIFESEATATYAAVFYPDSVCLATGGKHGCKWTEKSVFRVLRGRRVILYPDIDAHEEWVANSKILKLAGIDISVSKIIRNHALELSKQKEIEYEEFNRLKFDMRDILKFKIPPAPNASNIPQAAAEPTKEQIRKLDAVAERILMSQQSYTPQEVQQLMEAMLKISSERAATGLQKMIDFGAIQMTGNGMYYLRDSTPF